MASERFRVVTALPPEGGWRLELAVDRAATPPRPVALARVPAAISGDAQALAALMRAVDQAGRAGQPGTSSVLGLAEAVGGLSVVCEWVDEEALRGALAGLVPAGEPSALAAVPGASAQAAGAVSAARQRALEVALRQERGEPEPPPLLSPPPFPTPLRRDPVPPPLRAPRSPPAGSPVRTAEPEPLEAEPEAEPAPAPRPPAPAGVPGASPSPLDDPRLAWLVGGVMALAGLALGWLLGR